MYNFCAFDLLQSYKNLMETSYEQNLRDTPKQEEFSSVLQQWKALVDIQIESFGHWESVAGIQDLDSTGLVKTGVVIDDTEPQWPPCDGLHQQEA